MKLLIALALIQVVTGAALLNEMASCNHICTMDWSPVCGTDGKTYSNKCALSTATCMDATVTLGSMGECSTIQHAVTPAPCQPMMCMAMYAPVCGSDGITYSNMCEMKSVHCHGDVSMVHQGPCLANIGK